MAQPIPFRLPYSARLRPGQLPFSRPPLSTASQRSYRQNKICPEMVTCFRWQLATTQRSWSPSIEICQLSDRTRFLMTGCPPHCSVLCVARVLAEDSSPAPRSPVSAAYGRLARGIAQPFHEPSHDEQHLRFERQQSGKCCRRVECGRHTVADRPRSPRPCRKGGLASRNDSWARRPR